jgi:hypothetical protein
MTAKFASLMYPLSAPHSVPSLRLQLLELPYSFSAVRTFIRKQTADFYRLCQEEAALVGSGSSPKRSIQPTSSSGGAQKAPSRRRMRRESLVAAVQQQQQQAPLTDAALDRAVNGQVSVATVAKEGLSMLTGGRSSTPGAGTGLAADLSDPAHAAVAALVQQK